ncbi:uncharacterized protein PV07_02052 [Cladophialophora immunda]|uniref:Uncharacterized protein n=1 Tax=Cladophialophora immunda TaxID=569365 RepID=A0A0D2BCW4_9EURO|nr:uncharacterized protein PV07_02052 [Cladophialophora immunda]KIW35352.1 hypothetical protein PV07_02052 [Cladophialophora immunda]
MINEVWGTFPIPASIVLELFRNDAVENTMKDDGTYNIEAYLPNAELILWSFTGIAAKLFNRIRVFSSSS